MAETEKLYAGIGGWLTLPLVGLFIGPIRMVFLLLKDFLPIFTEANWTTLTTPSTKAYHPLSLQLIIFKVTGNIIFIILSIALLRLFFRKSRLLPKLMIACLILNLFFVGGDFLLVNMITIPAVVEKSDPESVRELARSIIGVVVWVPYFLISKRVRQTFVR